MSPQRKELIAQNLLFRGKIKNVLSHAHVCSLEQAARTAHDQNEQTLDSLNLNLIWKFYITTTCSFEINFLRKVIKLTYFCMMRD